MRWFLPPGRSAGVSRRLYDEFLCPMLMVTLFAPGHKLSAAAALDALYYFALAHQVGCVLVCGCVSAAGPRGTGQRRGPARLDAWPVVPSAHVRGGLPHAPRPKFCFPPWSSCSIIIPILSPYRSGEAGGWGEGGSPGGGRYPPVPVTHPLQ